MEWLKQFAPTIASALGGPLAGLATQALGKALGMSPDDAKAALEASKMTAEQIAQVQLAEIELKKSAQSLGLDFEKLAVDDRKSARDMQTQTRAIIPGVLAIGVTVGFFGILVGMMTQTVEKTDALMVMLGSLGTAWVSIVQFYFGSSASSQNKDLLLHNSTPIK